MLHDGTSIFCERCGRVLPVAGPFADAHYCVGCRFYTCSSCWNSTALRCVGCAGEGPERGPPGTRGQKAARRSMRDLRGVRSELLAISAREGVAKDTAGRDELAIERRLLTIRAESASAAVLAALEHVRTPAMAQRLRREVDAEMRNIAAVWRPPPEAPARHRRLPTLRPPALPTLRLPTLRLPTLRRLPALPTLRLPTARLRALLTLRVPVLRLSRPRRPTVRMPPRGVTVLTSAALGAAFVAVAVIASLNLVNFQGVEPEVGPPALSEGAREGVAGGAPSRSPAPTSRPAPREAVHMPFDELIMGADVSVLWDMVSGGGDVEVAPFPNAVDRSLKLTGSPSGDPATLCDTVSPLGEVPLRVSADLLIAGDAEGASVRMELDDAAIGMVIGERGEVAIEPSGHVPAGTVAAAQWYRVALTIDPDRGTFWVNAVPRNGHEVEGSEQNLPATWSTLSDPRLCISGPGVAGAELFLDNVSIE